MFAVPGAHRCGYRHRPDAYSSRSPCRPGARTQRKLPDVFIEVSGNHIFSTRMVQYLSTLLYISCSFVLLCFNVPFTYLMFRLNFFETGFTDVFYSDFLPLIQVEISFYLLRRLPGVKADGGKGAKVQKLSKGEILLVNIGSTSTGGKVIAMKKDMANLP